MVVYVKFSLVSFVLVPAADVLVDATVELRIADAFVLIGDEARYLPIRFKINNHNGK